jgi:hypothetical protein
MPSGFRRVTLNVTDHAMVTFRDPDSIEWEFFEES